MNNKDIMAKFIEKINSNNKMTNFLKNILNYKDIKDYNYIFRMVNNYNNITIDLYDNVSDNRFNRYVFHFSKGKNNYFSINNFNIFVTDLYIYNLDRIVNNLEKLTHLFSLKKSEMIKYGSSFLDNDFIEILTEIINKSN